MDVYQEVTDRMIAQLEQGRVPWRKPWNVDTGRPRSLDGRPYRGINVWLLGTTSYTDPRWGTYRAIARHGGQVRKGERGTQIVLWKPYEKRDAAEGESKRGLMLRYFTVFNVEQADGLDLPPLNAATPLEADDVVDTIDMVWSNYADAPSYAFGGDRAYYDQVHDHVQLPPREAYTSTRAIASTEFHEMAHSTGHKDRLNRDDLRAMTGFGSTPYSREELVAEMGAAMIAASVGIEPEYEQSATYISGWLRALQDDKRLLVTAAGRAQKAADLVLGNEPEPYEAPAAEAVAA